MATMPSPSADLVVRVRRLSAEMTSTTYSDTDISAFLAAHPLRDSAGLESTETDWVGAWDSYQAAADIWEEKAAAVVGSFDYSADGGSFSRSQQVQQMHDQAKRLRARGSAKSVKILTSPVQDDTGWIGNLPEAIE